MDGELDTFQKNLFHPFALRQDFRRQFHDPGAVLGIEWLIGE